MIKVLIIDDSIFIRTIVSDMLSSDPDITVIGTASDGVEALEKIRELKPDVITLDIEMPKMSGLQVLEHRKEFPTFPKTLMLSSLTSEGAAATKEALLLGADDFLLKPKGISNVREAGGEICQKIHNLISIPIVHVKEKTSDKAAEVLILIGSSAGGPPMLDIILSSFPNDIRAAVVVTQHMPTGGFTAALAARLNKISPLTIQESSNGDILSQGQVYVSKAGYHTVISSYLDPSGKKAGKIIHTTAPPVHNVRPAVDKTFISASEVYGPRIVSVILSGMGRDGGEGTQAVKEKGGVTFVCRQEDCLVYGMARSALDTNCVDEVLPLTAIADRLADTAKAIAK